MVKTIIIISALLILAIGAAAQDSTRTQLSMDSARAYLTAGVRWNQGHPAGVIGITKKLSNRVLLYIGGDLEGIQRAGSAQALLHILYLGPVDVHALLGPQTETVQPDPDEATTLTYITGATGFIFDYHPNNSFGLWTGFEYLITDATMKHWKFGIGLYAPISLGF